MRVVCMFSHLGKLVLAGFVLGLLVGLVLAG